MLVTQPIVLAREIASTMHENPKGVLIGNHDTSAIVQAALAAVTATTLRAVKIAEKFDTGGPETYEVRAIIGALCPWRALSGGRPMTPDTMPNGFPIERAKDWIGRWKTAGGGFFCHPNAETGEVMVQLASQGSLLDEPEVRNRKAEKIQSLQDELLKEPALKSAITTLVADTWAMARQRAQGNEG